jgi:hypothetical protein
MNIKHMNILLKELIQEVEPVSTDGGQGEENPLKVQIYCDMDGVLVNMNKGFKAISGGFTAETLRDKYHGDKKLAQREFWKLINGVPNFWINLEAMPDAMVLWKYLIDNFKDPVPVVLSAGQGSTLAQQKTEWCHRHLGPQTRVILAPAGTKKAEYLVKTPSEAGQYITHVLIDDTQKNIDAWNNTELHRVGILHHNAAETIRALTPFIKT